MKSLALTPRRLCLIYVIALGACTGEMRDASASDASAPDAAPRAWSTPTEPCDPLDAHRPPDEVVVELVADAQDGSRIVVTRPKDDWTYEDFRVFYGMNGHLFERVTSFAGARSYRAFDFIVEGASWHVTFASSLNPSIESTLETGRDSLPLALVDPPAASPDDTFECFISK